jgi:plasmid stabilization system protein ParE
MKVRFSEQGFERVQFVDDWWRANRDKAPDLFDEELNRIVTLLPRTPNMGTRYAEIGGLVIRRVLLKKTRQYVYYWVDTDNDIIEIVSVWGTKRGKPPLL